MTQFRCVLLGCAALVAISAPVRAADAPEELGDIVVTAQKRSEKAFDVPVTITALRGETLEKIGVSEFDDLALFVPGVAIQEQSPNNPGFVIRGITSDDGSSQIAPRVSIYYNGIDVSRARGSYFDLFDIDRTEIVKGPQATLFGTAAAIGAISVISNKPTPETSAALNAGIGNFGAVKFGGFVNGGSDVFSGRLAWTFKHRDGYVKNIAGSPGSQTPTGPRINDLNSSQVFGARGSLRWNPTEDIRADFVVTFDRQTPTGTAFRSGTFAPTGGSTNFYGFAEIAGAPEALSAQFLGGPQPGLKRSVWDVNLTVAYALSDAWSLNSITGYRDFKSNEVFDADGSQAFYLEFAEDAKGKQFSQEFRANYTSDVIKGFVGGTVFVENGVQRVPFVTEEGTYLQCAARLVPNLPCVAPDGTVTAAQATALLTRGAARQLIYSLEFGNTSKITTYAVFADATYTPVPQLDVTLGLRYTTENRRSGFFSRAPNSVISRAPLLPVFNTNLAEVRASASNTALLPRFNLLFRATDTLNIYATVGKGRRSPVLQVSTARVGTSGALEAVTNPIPAESIWSFESGFKAQGLPGNSRVSAAVFYQTYKNFQVQVSTGTGQIITRNAGTAKNIGVEGEFSSRPVAGVEIFGNLGYINARIDNKPENGIFAGSRFRLAPKWDGAVGVLFDRVVSDDYKIFLTPTLTYESSKFFELPNRALISQGPVTLVNLRAGFGSVSGSWKIQATSSNLFNKKYLIDAGNTGGAFGIPTFIPGAPRFYGLEGQVTF